VLLSLMLTGLNLQDVSGGPSAIVTFVNLVIFKVAALPISVLSLFLVYWLLPNRRVDPARVAPVAIWVGLTLEGMKYVNMLLAPWLSTKFEHEYYVFQHSVTLLIWSFIAALIVLAGAHWTARHELQDPLS